MLHLIFDRISVFIDGFSVDVKSVERTNMLGKASAVKNPSYVVFCQLERTTAKFSKNKFIVSKTLLLILYTRLIVTGYIGWVVNANSS